MDKIDLDEFNNNFHKLITIAIITEIKEKIDQSYDSHINELLDQLHNLSPDEQSRFFLISKKFIFDKDWEMKIIYLYDEKINSLPMHFTFNNKKYFVEENVFQQILVDNFDHIFSILVEHYFELRYNFENGDFLFKKYSGIDTKLSKLEKIIDKHYNEDQKMYIKLKI